MQQLNEASLAVSNLPSRVPGRVLDFLLHTYIHDDELEARLSENVRIRPPDSVCTNCTKNSFESISDVNGEMIILALADHSLGRWRAARLDRSKDPRARGRPPGVWTPSSSPARPPSSRSSWERTASAYAGGNVDVLAKTPSGSNIWKIKITSALTVEDKLQVAFYGLLRAKQDNRKKLPTIILYNVENG
ncbi:hypothetical protein B0H17DRAFT_126913 [Mycena rosella]|uniref:Uncharacterized protein n=1 Tax=Mycena rosella TaxID=1033263 RepID=A0AAD7D2V9_MYCRO|nr:hypothetical protein B0H17DRAFT_126913 [Mycena rosella]